MKDEKPEGHSDGITKELNRTHQEWENIFQALGHPAVILDPQLKIIAANNSSIKLTGQPAGELLGKKCYEIFHGKDTVAPFEGCPIEKMLKSGLLEPFKMEMETPGGFFLVSCTPVLDEQGNLEKLIHIATDITERKRAEEALKESQRVQDMIIETAPT